MSGIPLVVDTDTAADDCFALLVALLDPRADLKAITIVAGNVGFDQQVHNALLTMHVAGRSGEVPVYTGARQPLEREWVDAEDVHGDGVGGLRFEGDAAASGDDGVGELVRLAREYAGELRVIAIGPLTNIALAVQADPAFAANVAALYVMGGSVNARGNITPAAEYNMFVDPEAAQIVFDAGFENLVIISWDPLTITDAVFGPERIERIAAADTELSRFFITANQATYDFDLAAGLGGSSHCDSLTAVMAIDDSYALETSRYRVDCETAGELTRGATVFDWKSEDPNCTVVERADGERFFDYLLALLSTSRSSAS